MTNEITIIKESDKQKNEKSLEVCLREEAVREQSRGARELFTSLQNELDEIEGDLKDGLSYLDMKNDTLLSYMIDFCNIVLKKVRGDTISGHASVERSVYYRVILEKIKAIDQRLAYQLNKVITMPEEEQGVDIKNLDVDIGSGDDGAIDEDDDEDDEEDEEDEEDDEDEEEDEDEEGDGNDDDDEEGDEDVVNDHKGNARSSSTKKPVGVYKPPKLRAVAYREDGRRKRDYSDIYQDDDGNQEIVDESYVERNNERTRYEEENYTRLPDVNPKRAKRKLKAKEMASRGKKFKGSKGKKKGGGGRRK